MPHKLTGRTLVQENIKLSEDLSYPIFIELYGKQKKAIWFPEELNIQQDALDYHSLTEDEKDLSDTAVGYFCSSELLVQNVLINSFFPLLTDPHAKMKKVVSGVELIDESCTCRTVLRRSSLCSKNIRRL